MPGESGCMPWWCWPGWRWSISATSTRLISGRCCWAHCRVLVAAFCYPLGNQLVWEAQRGRRGLPQIDADLLANSFTKVLLLSIGSLPFWLLLYPCVRPGSPSDGQLLNAALVAVSSGGDRHHPVPPCPQPCRQRQQTGRSRRHPVERGAVCPGRRDCLSARGPARAGRPGRGRRRHFRADSLCPPRTLKCPSRCSRCNLEKLGVVPPTPLLDSADEGHLYYKVSNAEGPFVVSLSAKLLCKTNCSAGCTL